jgi:hypothetical protein
MPFSSQKSAIRVYTIFGDFQVARDQKIETIVYTIFGDFHVLTRHTTNTHKHTKGDDDKLAGVQKQELHEH